MSQHPSHPNQPFTLAKLILQKLNTSLSTRNTKKKPTIWHSIYKWNYDHHFIKNILKLTNKILKGLNKYHVFKVDYVYLAVGLGLGWVANEVEGNWGRVENWRGDVQPKVADLLVEQVLRNDTIRLKLQQAVNDNVLQNEDIQTLLHFVLINKVLTPQQHRLNSFVKQALLQVLRSQQVLHLAQTQSVKAIQQFQPLIAKEALNFLGGEEMHKIITTFVPPVIRGEMVQSVASQEVVGFVTSQLNNQVNQEKVYSYLREKII